ncbi:MAG: hypothetical protein A2Z99_00425 [Treponema sp. GWB1_62_6]|nr:MAG: hypothetical protein A2Z99_00425 [Treponema sp. GWB1_62_6]
MILTDLFDPGATGSGTGFSGSVSCPSGVTLSYLKRSINSIALSRLTVSGWTTGAVAAMRFRKP